MPGRMPYWQVKEKCLAIWAKYPNRFIGYKFLDSFGSGAVTYRCSNGHVGTARLADFNVGKRCGPCYSAVKHTEEYIRTTILDAWGRNVKFLGYILLRVYFSNTRWRYVYKCPGNHERDIMWQLKFFGCSHTDHPSCQAKPQSEYRQKILDHWASDPRIWHGYKLLELGQYTAKTTKIECDKGHLTTTYAYRILCHNAGCYDKECIAVRKFQRGTNYKYFTYVAKVYKYQGYEDKLLKILLKRFVSDTVNTNAMYNKPKSYQYLFDNEIHHYFPDIHVRTPGFDRWYEVKSSFTYDYDGQDDQLRDQNHTKWQSAAIKGKRIFDAYIWEKDQKFFKIIRYYPSGDYKIFYDLKSADLDEPVIEL